MVKKRRRVGLAQQVAEWVAAEIKDGSKVLALEAQLEEVEAQLANVKKELSVPRNQLRRKAFEAAGLSDVEHLVRELRAGDKYLKGRVYWAFRLLFLAGVAIKDGAECDFENWNAWNSEERLAAVSGVVVSKWPRAVNGTKMKLTRRGGGTASRRILQHMDRAQDAFRKFVDARMSEESSDEGGEEHDSARRASATDSEDSMSDSNADSDGQPDPHADSDGQSAPDADSDGESEPERSPVAEDSTYSVGEDIEARWKGDDEWFPGVGTCVVKFPVDANCFRTEGDRELGHGLQHRI